MQYDIKAKPTTYNGRLYRSRLEAKWAAFFDMMRWKYEYEPFDLPNWSPDFSLTIHHEGGAIDNILVEVKPSPMITLDLHRRIQDASRDTDYKLLLLSEKIVSDQWATDPMMPMLGGVYQKDGKEYHEFMYCRFYNLTGSYISFKEWDNKDDIEGDDLKDYLNYHFKEAGNKVMFLKP